MAEQETEQQDEQQTDARSGDEGSPHEKAEDAKERYERAEQKIQDLEEDPPTNLEDWPDDEAKYITLGGTEGDKSYDEGPTKNLGPHDLQRHDDGSVSIEGEKVDDPDEYKADPIPGGPTDPNAPKLAGEEKKQKKLEREGKSEGKDDDSSVE